jgi:hypothetical protein
MAKGIVQGYTKHVKEFNRSKGTVYVGYIAVSGKDKDGNKVYADMPFTYQGYDQVIQEGEEYRFSGFFGVDTYKFPKASIIASKTLDIKRKEEPKEIVHTSNPYADNNDNPYA